MFQPRVVLYPTDLSASSSSAFQIAADIAREHGAVLLILHVVETLGPENVTYGEAVSALEPESYHRRLEEDLHRLVPAPTGVSVQYILAAGAPAYEIERVAREHSCDLIVMGTRGRTGLSRLLVRGTAEQVISLAHCPVLITKSPITRASTSK